MKKLRAHFDQSITLNGFEQKPHPGFRLRKITPVISLKGPASQAATLKHRQVRHYDPLL